MFHYDRTNWGYERWTDIREDIMWSIMASVGDDANKLDLDAYADVFYRYEPETGRYYARSSRDINTKAIEECVLVPHQQYKLRDSLGEEIVVSQYTPLGPIEWFVTGPLQVPYNEWVARKISGAMLRGCPEEFEHGVFKLVPIPPSGLGA